MVSHKFDSTGESATLAPDPANLGRFEEVWQPVEGRRLPGIALATPGLWRPLLGSVSGKRPVACLNGVIRHPEGRLPYGLGGPRPSTGAVVCIAVSFLGFHFESVSNVGLT